ncbi:kinase-like domain-containing protein [Boletus edulis]|nr:kinase-like domain-containing protein [Boletus edulis]
MHNGSLHHFLEKYDDNLCVEHRLQFLQDIANGLQQNNVLLDADYTLAYLQRSTARPGALRWSPPEQILSEETFMRTTKSDIYSFGCVALQVLSGKRPWSELQEEAAIVLRVAKGHKPGRPKSRMMDDSHWHLIQECWSSMEERPTAEVIKSAIQQFLNDGPRYPPLHDLIQSWSSQVDHGAELLSLSWKSPRKVRALDLPSTNHIDPSSSALNSISFTLPTPSGRGISHIADSKAGKAHRGYCTIR